MRTSTGCGPLRGLDRPRRDIGLPLLVSCLTRVSQAETKRCPPDILCPARLRHWRHGRNPPLPPVPSTRRVGRLGLCGGPWWRGAAWSVRERGRGRAPLPMADDPPVDRPRASARRACAQSLCRPSVRGAARHRRAAAPRPAPGGPPLLGRLSSHAASRGRARWALTRGGRRCPRGWTRVCPWSCSGERCCPSGLPETS